MIDSVNNLLLPAHLSHLPPLCLTIALGIRKKSTVHSTDWVSKDIGATVHGVHPLPTEELGFPQNWDSDYTY